MPLRNTKCISGRVLTVRKPAKCVPAWPASAQMPRASLSDHGASVELCDTGSKPHRCPYGIGIVLYPVQEFRYSMQICRYRLRASASVLDKNICPFSPASLEVVP